jgi:hypothetical protein
MAQFQLGSVSTGTLRIEDLIPAFRNALAATGNSGSLALHSPPVDNRDELATLEIALQEACPPFVYFGSLEGDGADFGFWVDHDTVLELILNAEENEEGDAFLTEDGLLAHDGHDTTYMDMERNVIWSTV